MYIYIYIISVYMYIYIYIYIGFLGFEGFAALQGLQGFCPPPPPHQKKKRAPQIKSLTASTKEKKTAITKLAQDCHGRTQPMLEDSNPWARNELQD